MQLFFALFLILWGLQIIFALLFGIDIPFLKLCFGFGLIFWGLSFVIPFQYPFCQSFFWFNSFNNKVVNLSEQSPAKVKFSWSHFVVDTSAFIPIATQEHTIKAYFCNGTIKLNPLIHTVIRFNTYNSAVYHNNYLLDTKMHSSLSYGNLQSPIGLILVIDAHQSSITII